jgi:hypothetical protein
VVTSLLAINWCPPRRERGKEGAAAFYFSCHWRVGQGGELGLYLKGIAGQGWVRERGESCTGSLPRSLSPAMHLLQTEKDKRGTVAGDPVL